MKKILGLLCLTPISTVIGGYIYIEYEVFIGIITIFGVFLISVLITGFLIFCTKIGFNLLFD